VSLLSAERYSDKFDHISSPLPELSESVIAVPFMISGLGAFAGLVAAVLAVRTRMKRGSRVERLQLKWLTVRFSAEAIEESPFPAEHRLMRRNIEAQNRWLVLSPGAEQIVASTGHAVEEDDPRLVIDAILDAVNEAR
jgi:hypothetical protein